MLRLSLSSILSFALFAQTPTTPAAQPATTPAPTTTHPIKPQPAATAAPTMPPVVTPAPDPRKLMLKNLIQAGVLMLEGKAYRQFIQAFVDDEDRRGFERAFGKNGFVDYNEWGRDKGEQMLSVLRKIAVLEPVMSANRACFRVPDIPKGKFSFILLKGSWFIENKSQCPASTVEGSQPDRVKVK